MRIRYLPLPGDRYLVVLDRVPGDVMDALADQEKLPRDAGGRFLAFEDEVEIPQLGEHA